jgi:hypothetical protein
VRKRARFRFHCAGHIWPLGCRYSGASRNGVRVRRARTRVQSLRLLGVAPSSTLESSFSSRAHSQRRSNQLGGKGEGAQGRAGPEMPGFESRRRSQGVSRRKVAHCARTGQWSPRSGRSTPRSRDNQTRRDCPVGVRSAIARRVQICEHLAAGLRAHRRADLCGPPARESERSGRAFCVRGATRRRPGALGFSLSAAPPASGSPADRPVLLPIGQA